MNDQRLICGECCVTLNIVHNFRQMCLRSKTQLITHNLRQTDDHISGTVKVGLQEIKPELIVVKNRGESEMEGSNCLEGSSPQIKFQTESYKENIEFSASVKEECESEDDNKLDHEDATVDHINESACSDVKVEDVEHQTLMEDYPECYIEFTKIEIEERRMEEVKEEPMSDTETPQDGSISQADTGTFEEPMGSEEIIETKHMTSHSNERPYECEICKNGFNHKSYLTKHMKSHINERPYGCEICHKRFNRKSILSKHMKAHSSERPHECDICKKCFKYRDILTAHMKTHSSERPYECEICKKGFRNKIILTGHMKSHSNERPYECDICKKCFKQKINLTGHMKSHSSERPYECDICKKGFKHTGNLTTHMKTHSSERPYECEICRKRFDKKISCIRHMKKHNEIFQL